VWRATFGALIGAAALLALGVAPASAATTYHAAPEGSGTTCSLALPCSLNQGIASANASGDTLLLAGNAGSYGTEAAPLSTTVQPAPQVTFAGEPGQPAPVFYSAAANFGFIVQSGVKIGGIQVHYLPINGNAIYMTGPSTVERSYIDASGLSGTACSANPNGVIVDSVCTGAYAIDELMVGGPSTWPITLINDTLVSKGHVGMTLSSSGPAMTVSLVNTIVAGEPKDIDLENSSGGGTVVVTASHSNYDQVEVGSGGTLTAPGTAGNQTAPPALVSVATGDYAQLPTSPTVDAGEALTTNGALDLLGNPRALFGQPSCEGPHPGPPDIGAYELVPATLTGPTCEPPAPPSTGSGAGTTHPSPSPAPLRRLATAKVSEVKLHPASGTATLIVRVSGPGKLSATGKGLVKATATANAAGLVKLKLEAKAKAAKKLLADGKAQVKAKIVFKPVGAPPVTATKRLALKLQS
jgi:hypothetical protein